MFNTNVINFKKNDEYYTPEYVVRAIIPYIQYRGVNNIWCPADTEDSKFVKLLREEGFNVFYSHIGYGEDFLKININDLQKQFPLFNFSKTDLILTNPPFSLKNQFIEKAIQLGIPFMFLLGLQVLNYKGIAELMRDSEASLIYLIGSRISYDGNTSTFQSSFITNFIKNKIVYVDLNKEE